MLSWKQGWERLFERLRHSVLASIKANMKLLLSLTVTLCRSLTAFLRRICIIHFLCQGMTLRPNIILAVNKWTGSNKHDQRKDQTCSLLLLRCLSDTLLFGLVIIVSLCAAWSITREQCRCHSLKQKCALAACGLDQHRKNIPDTGVCLLLPSSSIFSWTPLPFPMLPPHSQGAASLWWDSPLWARGILGTSWA